LVAVGCQSSGQKEREDILLEPLWISQPWEAKVGGYNVIAYYVAIGVIDEYELAVLKNCIYLYEESGTLKTNVLIQLCSNDYSDILPYITLIEYDSLRWEVVDTIITVKFGDVSYVYHK
jgi:hypothetical protein